VKLDAQQRALEKVVKKEHPDLLKGLPGDKKVQLLKILATQIPVPEGMMITHTQTTASPVPPAEMLMGYNSAFPDGANRLFSLVEDQSRHRQGLETTMIGGQLSLARTGQWIAAVLVLVLIGCGTFLAIKDHGTVAGTIFSTTVIGLAGTFIYGQQSQKRNLDKKAPK
jgi:uncharacterized membrane protein